MAESKTERDYKNRSRKIEHLKLKTLKNFITKFKLSQKELLGLIAKKQLNIVSVNGIPSSQPKGADSVTHEEALRIFKEYDEYVKESRKFEADSTKVIVSKKLFLNLLSKFNECNLFMFTKLDQRSRAQLFIEKEKREIIDYSTEKKWPKVCYLLLGLMIIAASAWFAFSKEGNEDAGAKIFLVVMFLLIGMGVVIFQAFQIKSVEKAKSKIDTVTGNDFLKFGYDHDVDYYSPSSPMWLDETTTKKVSISFANMPNYSEMIADSIPMQGLIGYIVRKNDEAQFSLHNMTLRMMGPVIPVIILKHSIIFDTAYLQNIDSYTANHDHTKPPGEFTVESLYDFVDFNLTPKMFL